MSSEDQNTDDKTTLSVTADRVSYGAGRKVSDGNYGSYDFHCSVSTDVKGGEQPLDAVKRAVKYVETVLASKIKQAGEEKMGY